MLQYLFAAIALFMSTAASAQWLHQKGDDNPFKGGAEQFSLVFSQLGVMAGIRCTNADDLTIMFLPIDKPNDLITAALISKRARLLVIVDKDPRVALDAEVEITPDGERYRFTATGASVAGIVAKTASARDRLAIAVELDGQIVWSESFRATGSRRALQPLMKSCGLGG